MFELINNPYLDQEIATIVVLFLYFILRVSSKKLVRKYATLNEVLEHRSNLVIKYIYLLLGILAFISIVIIWGVKKDQIFLFISSVFAVAGVASFAQWSILSNITAGIILFFSYPFNTSFFQYTYIVFKYKYNIHTMEIRVHFFISQMII